MTSDEFGSERMIFFTVSYFLHSWRPQSGVIWVIAMHPILSSFLFLFTRLICVWGGLRESHKDSKVTGVLTNECRKSILLFL